MVVDLAVFSVDPVFVLSTLSVVLFSVYLGFNVAFWVLAYFLKIVLGIFVP